MITHLSEIFRFLKNKIGGRKDDIYAGWISDKVVISLINNAVSTRHSGILTVYDKPMAHSFDRCIPLFEQNSLLGIFLPTKGCAMIRAKALYDVAVRFPTISNFVDLVKAFRKEGYSVMNI